jgi:hypothetical protein
MPQTYLIFDFGTNEDAVQQARHKLDGWKQGFRLDRKLLYQFERSKAEEKDEPGPKKGKAKEKAKHPEEKAEGSGKVRVLVQLGFSDHERLSHQRWVERIPAEEPFKAASPKSVSRSDGDFKETKELFEALNRRTGNKEVRETPHP